MVLVLCISLNGLTPAAGQQHIPGAHHGLPVLFWQALCTGSCKPRPLHPLPPPGSLPGLHSAPHRYIYNCHSSANNPTWTNDQLKFMVLADMQAEPVPQDTCFGGKAKALQRFTVAYSYLLIAFLALIAVLWIGSTIPGLITSVQKWRRKRR